MKFLKGLFLFVFIVIVLAVIGLVILAKTFNINQYKGKIESLVSRQIGRSVSIEGLGLDVSLFKGLYAQAVGVKIGEDPRFGFDDFVNITAVKLKVDILAFLSRREILVSEVAVESPTVNLVRDERGSLNAQAIGPAGDDDVPAAGGGSAAKGPAAAGAAMPKFSIEALTITDGTVRFQDRTQAPPLNITVSQLFWTVKDLSLTDPFRFEGRAALFNEIPNLTFSGQAAVNVNAQEVRLSFVEADLDLAKMTLKDLLNSIPQLRPAGLKDMPEGRITVQVPSLTAGNRGLTSLSFTGKLSDGKVSVQSLPVPLDQISADLKADARDIYINDLSLKMLTGTITGSAKISDYPKTQGLDLKMAMKEVPPEAFVAQLPEGIELQGGINAQLNVTGQNLADPAQFLNSLSGTGQVNLKDGKLKDFNVLKVLLGRIPFLSGLSGAIEAGIPEEYQGRFVRNDTILREAASDIKISGGVVAMPNIHVLSDLFEANINFFVDPKMNATASGEVLIQSDFSNYLADKAEPFQYLKGPDGRIVIPLSPYEGPLADFKMLPNVTSVAKSAIETEGRKQLDKVLDKVFGPEEPAPAGEPQGNAPAPKSTPERELIEGVLDSILKKF